MTVTAFSPLQNYINLYEIFYIQLTKFVNPLKNKQLLNYVNRYRYLYYVSQPKNLTDSSRNSFLRYPPKGNRFLLSNWIKYFIRHISEKCNNFCFTINLNTSDNDKIYKSQSLDFHLITNEELNSRNGMTNVKLNLCKTAFTEALKDGSRTINLDETIKIVNTLDFVKFVSNDEIKKLFDETTEHINSINEAEFVELVKNLYTKVKIDSYTTAFIGALKDGSHTINQVETQKIVKELWVSGRSSCSFRIVQ